jgi:hypothetical protein
MEVWLSWTAVSAAAVGLYWLKLHYAAKHGVGNRGGRGARGVSPEIADELADLKAELRESCDELASQIEQLNERMDFTERVLADRVNPARIDPSRP